MIDSVKKFPILNIVLGTLLIVAGVLFVFVFEEIGESIKNIAIGIMILLIVIFLVMPGLRKPKSKLVSGLLIFEVIIGVLVSIMFILEKGGSPSLWIGLVIYVHGVVGLIGGYFSSKKQKAEMFFLSLLFATIGVYIFASNLITNQMLLNVLFVMFVAPGLFFLILGLIHIKKIKPKTKKA